jgi:protein-S-isoprenylcysteine O-methyltransferase Ste14
MPGWDRIAGVMTRGALPSKGYPLVGWMALAATFASMTAFALFVAGFEAPWSVDGVAGAQRASTLAALAVDFALLATFGLVHSLLARSGAKRLLARLWPQPLERALYSLVAAGQMTLLMALWRPLPALVWDAPPGFARAVLWAFQGLGWLIVLAALAAIRPAGITEFFGLAQARAGAAGTPFRSSPLVERGVYRFIRHPLYAGTTLALWSAPAMSQGRLLLAAVFTLYMAIGHRFEERDLLRERGESYRAYRSHVPAWLPIPRKGR